ncbi:dmX-like protein 1 isoform X2 [Sycon ciliatum]|uniref:dmX-like protein 1 isoform X2 n=1 Tax=Sycon ciliatum TaxID=27933 RepID=UPI0031F5F873
MRCEQVITGAVNNGSCVVTTGQIGELSFIAYASGSAVVILTPELGFIQKIEGESLGFGSQPALCVTSSEDCGRIAAAWGDNVCVFEAECLSSEERLAFPKAFLYKWCKITSVKASSPVYCLSFDKPGDRLLTGGLYLELWMATTPDVTIIGGVVSTSRGPSPLSMPADKKTEMPIWACTWRRQLAFAAEFVLFSPDGQLFATAGKGDRAVKIWYEVKNSLFGINDAPLDFTFTYVTHPRQVSSFAWRQTSPIIPCGVIANVLLTRCHDNVCRVWAQTPCHQDHYDYSQSPHHAPTNTAPAEGSSTSSTAAPISSQASAPYKVGSSLHFHLAGSIDQGANIPMHSSSTSSSRQQTSLFTVHWMDNKRLCLQFAAKAMLRCEKTSNQRSSDRDSPSSVHSEDSMVIVNPVTSSKSESSAKGSDSSSPSNSPMPQRTAGEFLTVDGGGYRSPANHPRQNGELEVSRQSRRRGETMMSSGNWVVVPALANPGQWVVVASPAAADDAGVNSYGLSTKSVRALLREWQSTPDMLFAIHPLDGSLLVWMIDGLDAVSPSFRLPRLSFASRIPHAMPTADIWTLQGTIFTVAGPCAEDAEDISKLLATPAKRTQVPSRSASGRSTPSAWMRRRRSGGVRNSSLMQRGVMGGVSSLLPSVASSPDVAHPSLVLISHHIGGALHVWSVDFARGSGYVTPFAMRQTGSAFGHRLPCQSALVHPSSSMLITAAHLKQQSAAKSDDSSLVSSSRAAELVLWHMHTPASVECEGDMLQLVSVLHSNSHGAFRQQCWIDSKIAFSTTELSRPVMPGGQPVVLRVGPSTLFISQDDDGALALFQVITDAVQWLGVHGGAANSADEVAFEECKRQRDVSVSLDGPETPSSSVSSPPFTAQGSVELGVPAMQLGYGDIVSRQCGSRPGCVLHLGSICDLESLPGDITLLHSFPLTDAWLKVLRNGSVSGSEDGDSLEGRDTYGEFDRPLISEGVENFLVVAIESRTPVLTEPSTPIHEAGDIERMTSDTLSMVKANTSSVLHTWLVTVHRHAVILPLDTKLEDPVQPPVVEIQSRRLAAQKMPLPLGVNVTSASVSTGHAESVSLDGVDAPPPWQVATVCSDKAVRFWRCVGCSADLLDGIDMEEGHHLDDHSLGDGMSLGAALPAFNVAWEEASQPRADDNTSLLRVIASSPSQLATVQEKPAKPGVCTVEVWDSSNSGGHAWQKEDLGFTLPCPAGSSNGAKPLWMSQLNGDNYLALASGNQMSLLQSYRSNAGSDAGSANNAHHWQHVATTEVSHMHDLVTATHGESSMEQPTDEPRATNDCCHAAAAAAALTSNTASMLPLAWSRGNLVVGYNGGSVLLVLSHWLPSLDDNYKSSRTTCLSIRTTRGGSGDISKPIPAVVVSSFDSGDTSHDQLSEKSILELASKNVPHLPQYHPDQLAQLLHAGRLMHVRTILVHLVQCLARRALLVRHLESRKHADADSDAVLWWRPSNSMDSTVVDDLYPMPLSQVLSAEAQRCDAPALPSVQTNSGASVDEREVVNDTDYDQLFGNNRGELNMELELELDFNLQGDENEDDSAEEIRVERENLNATTFGASQFDFLTSYLSKVRLAGLSSVEQMKLLALADTVASTHHQFSTEATAESGDSTDDGPQFTRQVLNASGASGAGYASRTEGGEEGIDDCGLRFLLSMRQFNCLMHSASQRQRGMFAEQGLSTAVFAWAFHSHAEEELLSLVPCVQSGRLKWSELRAVGVGWWLRSQESLRRLAEKIAKARFTVNQDPLDAALFYLAMKKQSLLRAMFRNARDDRMASFFANDFKEERWRKAALKNAFVLLGKQRLEQAAAFFLLGNSLDDCLEVCVHRMQDLQLALVVCRLFEGLGESGPVYQKMLRKYVLDPSAITVRTRPSAPAASATPKHSAPTASTTFVSNSSFGLSSGVQTNAMRQDSHVAPPCKDPFLRSLAHWILQDYAMALDTVLESVVESSLCAQSDSQDSTDADVKLFNFYFFLREHPLLLRRQYSAPATTDGFSSGRFNLMGNASATSTNDAVSTSAPAKPRISGVGSDPLTKYERRLLFQTAQTHLQHGRLILVLDVLSHLPVQEADDASPESESASETVEASATESDTALSFDWSQPSTTLDVGNTADSFDWSTPVSTLATSTEDTAGSFDWGAPVGLQLSSLDDDLDSALDLNKASGPSDSPVNGTLSASASASPDQNGTAKDKNPVSSQMTTYSVTQWSASALRWRAILNLVLREISAAAAHVMESGLVDNFLSELDEKARLTARAADDLATPTASLSADMSVPESAQPSSQWLPLQCMRTLDLRRFIWGLLVEELGVWHEMCGRQTKLTSFQKDALLRALHGTAARCQGDQIADAGIKWISENRKVLSAMWQYLDLNAPFCPPLQTALHEIGVLLQRPQPPAVSVVHNIAVAMFRTELAVNDHAHSPRRILQEVADLLPQAMPPFLLSASPLPCHTLWSPLSDIRNIAQQIFSLIQEYPTLPSANPQFDDKRIGQLMQLSGILSTHVIQSLSTVDHALSPRNLLHMSSGRCSPFAFSLVQHALPAHQQSRADSPPEVMITRDFTPTNASGTASSGASSSHYDTPSFLASRQELAPPSQWPGLRGWPRHLTNADWCASPTSDMVLLSLLLGEACVAVYLAMTCVALSKLSARNLLGLLKNIPNDKLWHATFGGGYRLSMGTSSGVGAHDGNATTGTDGREHRLRSGSLRKRMSETFNAAARRLHPHTTTGRDSTGSRNSDAGSTRRPRVVDVFMFPAVSLDEFFRTCISEIPQHRGSEDGQDDDDNEEKSSARKWKYCMDDVSELDLEEEESLPVWDDPKSAGWSLLQVAALNFMADGLKSFLPLIGVELAELPLWSPWIYNSFCQLDAWQTQAQEWFEASADNLQKMFKADQLVSADSLDVAPAPSGPAILQHKSLLEPKFNPFSDGSSTRAMACQQLWQYLVKQESIRDIFIANVFPEEAPTPTSAGSLRKQELSCLVYKESDVVSSITINQANPVQMVVATSREVVEIDTSFLLDASRQLWSEEDEETGRLRSDTFGSDDFLMVHNVPSLSDWSSRTSSPDVNQAQSGTGAVLLMRRQVPGIRHVECHPTVPYYLCGGEDGSVRLWEFGRNRAISSHRMSRSAPAVTKMHFTPQGNKFGASDVNGNVALWQFGSTMASSDPYVEVRCHNRCTNDFVFMSSTSFLATAGYSNDGKNVALYDFLVPPHKSLIRGFTCHEGGASSIIYAPSHQLIISAGKKGDICVFDVRQQALLNSLPAHNDGIRSLAMAENEEFFASGGADGSIKLWDVCIPRQRKAFTDEHVKTSFFRSAGSGVQQVLVTGRSTQLFSCGADGLVKWRVLPP